ncbi:MAG TPA: hypothetical protein VF742_09115, partial [Terracidiphilus sp.]
EARRELRPATKFPGGLEKLDKRVLGHIACIGLTPEHGVGEPVGASLVPFHQRFEGTVVARGDS